MRKLLFLFVGLLAASCVSPVPAEAQTVSVAIDKTNSWLRSTNFFRSNLFGGSGVTVSYGTNGSATISATAAGTVTSVDLSAPSFLTVGGNPITTSGTLTLTLADQAEKKVFIGPASGADAAPTFRLLQAGDIPDLSAVYQPLDADLTAIAGLASAANKLPYFTGSAAAALADFTAAGRAILDDADATAQRATLGLVIGTDVQAYDTQLTSVAGLSYAGNAGKVIAVNGGETGFELVAQGGGGATFNANQFGASVLGTNIKSGAIFTNTINYSLTIAEQESAVFTGGADNWSLYVDNADDSLRFVLDSVGNRLVFRANNVEPQAMVDYSFGVDGTPFHQLHFEDGTFTGGLKVMQSLTNSALTADKIVYSNGDKVLASVTPTAPVTFSGGTLAVSDMVGDSGAGGSSGLVPAPAAGDFAGLKFLRADGLWISPNTVTNNYSSYVTTGDIDEIDVSLAASTNVLAGALTIAHATNGISGYERTHVRWLWAGGSDRALTIPSQWKTNVYSAVPANITNGTITKMYVTTIGDTSSSANQTNVFVSFEFYK